MATSKQRISLKPGFNAVPFVEAIEKAIAECAETKDITRLRDPTKNWRVATSELGGLLITTKEPGAALEVNLSCDPIHWSKEQIADVNYLFKRFRRELKETPGLLSLVIETK